MAKSKLGLIAYDDVEPLFRAAIEHGTPFTAFYDDHKKAVRVIHRLNQLRSLKRELAGGKTPFDAFEIRRDGAAVVIDLRHVNAIAYIGPDGQPVSIDDRPNIGFDDDPIAGIEISAKTPHRG